MIKSVFKDWPFWLIMASILILIGLILIGEKAI